MNLVLFLLPLALALSALFMIWFVRAALSGQFDDLETPSHRILLDDKEGKVEHDSN